MNPNEAMTDRKQAAAEGFEPTTFGYYGGRLALIRRRSASLSYAALPETTPAVELPRACRGDCT